MATATRKSRAAGQLARRARIVRVPESIRFVIFDDNARTTYSCSECGHVVRVSGLGRDRVDLALDDESGDPVMNRVCSVCGHGLPGKNGV